MNLSASGPFRSLRIFNYRVWAAGAFVSNIGTWVQRTAQDWLVLTQLTAHSASAVGIVMACQYGPQMLLLPWTGWAADRFDQRRLLMVTQATMGCLALALGVLTLTGVVRLHHVYAFAFLLGCAAAFDAPVRQTFVSALVGDTDLSNAVALNSTSFNAARMIGPAVTGLAIAQFGTGWAFIINGASFFAVLLSLRSLHLSELHPQARAHRSRGSFAQGLRYVGERTDLKAMLLMLFLVGTFTLNFPIFISTMATRVFLTDARGFGLLMSTMAVGTVAGAFLAARRDMPRFHLLQISTGVLGIGCAAAALAPSAWLFAAALIVIGISALTFINSSNSLMQLTTAPALRGRVMALRLGVTLGGTPVGAPMVGWVADRFGPRWALMVGAGAALLAAWVAHRTATRGMPRGDTTSPDSPEPRPAAPDDAPAPVDPAGGHGR